MIKLLKYRLIMGDVEYLNIVIIMTIDLKKEDVEPGRFFKGRVTTSR